MTTPAKPEPPCPDCRCTAHPGHIHAVYGMGPAVPLKRCIVCDDALDSRPARD